MRTVERSDEEVNTLVWAIDGCSLEVEDYLEGTGNYADLPCDDAREAKRLRRGLAVLKGVRKRLGAGRRLGKLI